MIRSLTALAVAAALLAGPTGARAANVGDRCSDDNQCPLGSICGSESICTALPRKKSVIPFYFHQPGDSGYRHVVPLLYFHSWDKHRDTRVQVPLFAWRYDRDRDAKTTVVPLLFSSFTQSKAGSEFRIWPFVFMARYKPDGGQAAILPLFWWQKKQGHSWFVAPLLLSGGQRDDNNDLTEAVVGLVGYYRRHGDADTWRILFPLLWEHETQEARTLVGPLLWFKRTREGHDTGVIFPIIWHVQDDKSGYEHMLVLPLFDLESERRGRKQRLVSIIAAWERDDDIGLHQFLVYAPIIFHRADRKRTVDVVPPLFTRWSTRDDGSSGLIAGPLVATSDPSGSTTVLFPVYWRFHDRAHDATTHILFPVAAFHHHSGARGGFVGPIYGWSSANGDGGWGGGVAPVLMFGRSGPRRHALVLPLFAHLSDTRAGTSTTALGPLFYRKTADGGDGGILPLLFAGRHAGHAYAYLAPIFWHKSDANGTTDVLGPAYLTTGAHGWSAGVAPIFFFGSSQTRSHQVIAPLFAHFRDHAAHTETVVVGPYFHLRDGDQISDGLLPLFYVRRSPTRGLGIWLVGGWQRKDGVSTTVVGPFVHQSNARTGASTTLIFPLLGLHDSPRYSVRVLFPFVWRVRDGDETDTAIFPVYFRGRARDHGWDAVFPLFVHTYNATAATTLVGPIWYRARRDGGLGVGLFPLFAYAKRVGADGKQVSWFGMPLAFHDRNDVAGTTHTWVAPFFHSTRPDGYTTGLIPIVFAWRRGTASKVLTPGYYRQSDSARDYSLDVFTLLYVGHEGKSYKFGLFPLLMASHHDDGTWKAGVFPLFYAARRTDGSTVATLLGGYSSYSSGKRLYVGPFYYRHDDVMTSGAFFPLVYHAKNALTGTRTTFAIPLLLDTRAGDGRELQAYTPLVWRYRNVESSTLLGIPLFYDVERFHESRSTGLLPLFLRNRSELGKTTSYLLPPLLTWWRTGDHHGDGDGVFFPLVWRFGGARPTTIVAPFVWDFVRGESRTTVFFPVGARWRRSDAVHTLVFNTYYRKGIGPREGSWYLNVFPFVTLGRPRRHDIEWYFLEGLFGYSRQGRNRNLRLLWVLDIALEPVPASNLSWFGSTPPSARELF